MSHLPKRRSTVVRSTRKPTVKWSTQCEESYGRGSCSLALRRPQHQSNAEIEQADDHGKEGNPRDPVGGTHTSWLQGVV